LHLKVVGKGHVVAQASTGYCYGEGMGVDGDNSGVISLLRKAAPALVVKRLGVFSDFSGKCFARVCG